jgi:hypothetical protein
MTTTKQLTTEEKIKGTVTLVILILIAAFYLKYCTGNEAPAAPAKKQRTKIDVLVKAQTCVENNLKAPSTADFGFPDEEMVSQLNDSTYYVTGFVDAQNSFGAMLRSNYECRVTYLPDGTGYCDNIRIQAK